jgi:pimeloyl-ACP methyl ester carboxylesterase/DNA-binding winged helix-turn-helix (wHTH) protein
MAMLGSVLRLGEDLELDNSVFELRRGGLPVPMEPQVFDVLTYLVAHRDRVVPKEELMDAVWGGRFVSETAVTSRIKQVRRALGDDGQAQRFVRTLHGRGYRFVGDAVEATSQPGAAGHTDAGVDDAPTSGPLRYTVSDGLHIAYQLTGAAPDGGPRSDGPDIVLISGFVSHLELDWDDPRHARFLHRLAGIGRLIRFDKRGTGMSDRPEGVPDLEHRMHDVLAVMDAVGSERAVICGYSEGGPMALLLAATHPERVTRLVLYGSYARSSWAEDYPWAQTLEQRAEYTDRLVTTWDWEADIRRRNPSADEAMQRWWALRMRASATPGTVRALMAMNGLIDVRDVLPSVRVPTLVLHRRHDVLFDLAEAQYLARKVPGAELHVLEGSDHFVAGDPDQILDALEPFVRGASEQHDPEQPSVLSAVVALAGTDADVSDAVEALERSGGRRRATTDGRGVVLFDGPATAVRSARRMRGIGGTGSEVSLGLSVAEVPRGAAPLSGAGVELAVSLADQAPPGELWTSEVAAMLLVPARVELEPVPGAGGSVHRAT